MPDATADARTALACLDLTSLNDADDAAAMSSPPAGKLATAATRTPAGAPALACATKRGHTHSAAGAPAGPAAWVFTRKSRTSPASSSRPTVIGSPVCSVTIQSICCMPVRRGDKAPEMKAR